MPTISTVIQRISRQKPQRERQFYRRVEGVLICVCATTTRPDGQLQSSAGVASPINAQAPFLNSGALNSSIAIENCRVHLVLRSLFCRSFSDDKCTRSVAILLACSINRLRRLT